MFTKLRTLRLINEVSLDEMGQIVGLSVGVLSRLERGYVKDIRDYEKRNNLIRFMNKLQRDAAKLPIWAENET